MRCKFACSGQWARGRVVSLARFGSAALLVSAAAACSDPSSGQNGSGENAGGAQATANGGSSPASSTKTGSAQGGTSNRSSNKEAAVGGTSRSPTGSTGKSGSNARDNQGGNSANSTSTTGESNTAGGTSAGGSASGDSTGGKVSRGGASTGGSRSAASGGNSRGGSGGKASVAGGATSTSTGTAPNGTGGSAGGESNEASMLVPDKSWDCGMPNGIVPPSLGELVLRAELQIGKTYAVGETQFGDRRILDVKGGTLKGDRVDATFLTGGLDLELTLSNGNTELEQVAMLRATDGTLIFLRTCGVAHAGDGVVRIVPDFEVPNSSSLAWLNTGKFVGTRSTDTKSGSITLAIYDVSKVSSSAPRVELTDPAGVPNQSWQCSTATGAKGASVFTETVGIGSSLSIGASKRGSRNVIPITGGSMTGRVTGTVLAGGADFQLTSSGPTVLDARYTLAAKDGEFILVRNCGPMGAMVPTFEARAEGPYSFLNANTFVSSDPGMASGGVNITFYERK